MCKINLPGILLFMLIIYLAYYILLNDNQFHISISSIIASSHHLTHKQHLIIHLIILGLLPIYIGAIIFGAGLLSMFLGTSLKQRLVRGVKNK